MAPSALESSQGKWRYTGYVSVYYVCTGVDREKAGEVSWLYLAWKP